MISILGNRTLEKQEILKKKHVYTILYNKYWLLSVSWINYFGNINVTWSPK